MTSVKRKFIRELEPLLRAAEEAINKGEADEARECSLQMLDLVRQYADRLSPEELREALNNPTANAIAERLGVRPQ